MSNCHGRGAYAVRSRWRVLLHQRADHDVGFDHLQVLVGLADAHKHDRLAQLVHHRQRRAHLVVDRVELGEDDAVHAAALRPDGRVVDEALVELAQLVDAVVADEGLADEEHEVGLVVVDQLRKRAHAGLVVLHAARRVDHHDVHVLPRGLRDGGGGHRGRVGAVAHLEDGGAEAAAVHLQLLHRPVAEGVARGDEQRAAVLLQPVGDLRERRRFADAVHAAEDDGVGPLAVLRGGDVAQDVHLMLRLQDAAQRSHHRGLHRVTQGLEGAQLLAGQRGLDGAAHVLRDLDGDVLRDELLLQVGDDLLQVLLVHLARADVGAQPVREPPAGLLPLLLLHRRDGAVRQPLDVRRALQVRLRLQLLLGRPPGLPRDGGVDIRVPLGRLLPPLLALRLRGRGGGGGRGRLGARPGRLAPPADRTAALREEHVAAAARARRRGSVRRRRRRLLLQFRLGLFLRRVHVVRRRRRRLAARRLLARLVLGEQPTERPRKVVGAAEGARGDGGAEALRKLRDDIAQEDVHVTRDDELGIHRDDEELALVLQRPPHLVVRHHVLAHAGAVLQQHLLDEGVDDASTARLVLGVLPQHGAAVTNNRESINHTCGFQST
ncbi:signal recognition particle receptor subunit alpha [Strigomonas culicis]|uniref:Signal recognition particle receptor subunit alpha n=1 Tax=Strigomonas culicis TaxID=28005 RepID=S9TQB8_9TRYP|nr:signal recognition particle receptor subunit alpha [Strigomonas culicis]|eukprot:EPY20522.1 signal recognition particle receptor subunit alpha [Strigomonas culicis]